MKHLPVIVTLFFVVLGCDISRFVSNGARTNTNTSTPSVEKPAARTPVAEATPSRPAFLETLSKSGGKYPAEIKLLKLPELRDRLRKLLGKDHGDLEAHWNVESPIEIKNGIFKASACEAHNCGSNTYFIFVDIKNNNINVYHIEEGSTRDYLESGKIELPAGFLEF